MVRFIYQKASQSFGFPFFQYEGNGGLCPTGLPAIFCNACDGQTSGSHKFLEKVLFEDNGAQPWNGQGGDSVSGDTAGDLEVLSGDDICFFLQPTIA